MKQIYALILGSTLVPSATFAQTSENEPSNNLFATADTAVGASTYHINPSGDVDIIRMDVDTAGTLIISITGIPNQNAFYIDVKVYGSDTTTLIGRNPTSSGCWNCPSSTAVSVQLCVGTYYIHMKEDGGGSSANGFNVALTMNTADPCECNNTRDAACLMPVDTTFAASLSGRNLTMADSLNTAGSDVDWYLTYVPDPEVLVISVANIPTANQFYLDIEIFNTSGQLVARNPSSSGCWNCPSSTSVVAVLDSGWYHIRMKDDSYGVNNGMFEVTFRLDTLDQYNFNNHFSTATPIEVNTPFRAQLYGHNLTTSAPGNANGTDIDYFIFSLTSPSSVDVLASSIPLVNGFYLQMEIYAASDTTVLLAENPPSSCNNCPTTDSFAAQLDSGTYILRIRDNTGQTSVDDMEVLITAVSTVGANDPSLFTLSSFPNPTNGALDVRLPAGHIEGALLLLDATGRIAQQQRFAAGASRIALDLTNEQPGLYLLDLRFADGTRAVERVVRQ